MTNVSHFLFLSISGLTSSLVHGASSLVWNMLQNLFQNVQVLARKIVGMKTNNREDITPSDKGKIQNAFLASDEEDDHEEFIIKMKNKPQRRKLKSILRSDSVLRQFSSHKIEAKAETRRGSVPS